MRGTNTAAAPEPLIKTMHVSDEEITVVLMDGRNTATSAPDQELVRMCSARR